MQLQEDKMQNAYEKISKPAPCHEQESRKRFFSACGNKNPASAHK
jgi:hypothetical protein